VIAGGKAERVHFVFIDEAGGKRRHHGHPHRRLHGFQRDGAIARQFAAKRAGLFEQRLLIGEGLYKAQSVGLLGIDGIARQQ